MAFFASVCDINYVTYLVQRGVYLAEIARQCRELYPYSRGNSRRSVRRFCSLNGITRLTNDDIYKLVSNIVTVYGHTYGRKMTHGSINAQLDVTSDAVSQRSVAKALHQVEPRAYQARARDLVVRTNPGHIKHHILVIKVTLTRMKNWHNLMVAHLLMDAQD